MYIGISVYLLHLPFKPLCVKYTNCWHLEYAPDTEAFFKVMASVCVNVGKRFLGDVKFKRNMYLSEPKIVVAELQSTIRPHFGWAKALGSVRFLEEHLHEC